MAQRFQASQVCRPHGVDAGWLPRLIEAMEQAARPEMREIPCDPAVIAAVSAQLAQPVSALAHCGSAYSLRN